MNEISWLEIEFAHFEAAVPHISHYTTEPPPHRCIMHVYIIIKSWGLLIPLSLSFPNILCPHRADADKFLLHVHVYVSYLSCFGGQFLRILLPFYLLGFAYTEVFLEYIK